MKLDCVWNHWWRICAYQHARTWVLSLCTSFPSSLGALFNEVYQGFIKLYPSNVELFTNPQLPNSLNATWFFIDELSDKDWTKNFVSGILMVKPKICELTTIVVIEKSNALANCNALNIGCWRLRTFVVKCNTKRQEIPQPKIKKAIIVKNFFIESARFSIFLLPTL